MKQRHLLFVSLFPIVYFGVSGCSLILPNEALNSAFHSDEERIKLFKENTDHMIGKPFYGLKSEKCKEYICEIKGEKETEFISRTNPNEKCTLAWLVDESSAGKYNHPTNHLIFDITGKIKSWRYVSNPNLCLYTINYYGPW